MPSKTVYVNLHNIVFLILEALLNIFKHTQDKKSLKILIRKCALPSCNLLDILIIDIY